MAYDLKKVLTYGAVGIMLAAVLILFIPVRQQVGVYPYVTVEQIPGYGLQFIKISEEQADLTNLYVTIVNVEVQLPGGDWVSASNGETSWDLVQEIRKTIQLDAGDLALGSYSGVRLVLAQDTAKSNATLSNMETILVNIPLALELDVPEFTVEAGTDEYTLDLNLGQGRMSNQMLPEYHIAIGTVRLLAEVTVQ